MATDLPSQEASSSAANTHITAHFEGMSEHFASQADACFVVEAKHFPLHTALLTVSSPVLAEILSCLVPDPDAECCCIPLPGETVQDIQKALSFLYKRAGSSCTTPSTDLWKSFQETSAILKFAHKFNMQNILEECDSYLSEAAQSSKSFGQPPSAPKKQTTLSETDMSSLKPPKFAFGIQPAEVKQTVIFADAYTALEWASLADQCQLATFLAHVELAMLVNEDCKFWCDNNLPLHQLSQACLARLLRGYQYTMRRNSQAGFTPLNAAMLMSWKQSSKFSEPSHCPFSAPLYSSVGFGQLVPPLS